MAVRMAYPAHSSAARLIFTFICFLSLHDGNCRLREAPGDLADEIRAPDEEGGIPAENRDPEVPLRFPYVVSLLHGGTGAYLCGGALVDRSYVLTAAQCTSVNAQILVGIGKSEPGKYEEIIRVVERIQHPDWSGDKRRGRDIALLKLEVLSIAVPVDFPKSRIKLKKGEILTILSRGRSSHGGSFVSELQKIPVDYLTTRDCKETGVLMGELQAGMMCLGGKGVGICTGDEGSPVVSVGSAKERDLLLGIASFNEQSGCAGYYQPGIHTRVDVFGQWIQSVRDRS